MPITSPPRRQNQVNAAEEVSKSDGSNAYRAAHDEHHRGASFERNRMAVARLFEGPEGPARFTTVAVIDGDGASDAAEGVFEWVLRLAPV